MLTTTALGEVLGVIAVVLLVAVVVVAVDPTIRARRAANRIARIRRHTAAGCLVCRLDLEALRIEAEVRAQRVEWLALEASIAAEEARR